MTAEPVYISGPHGAGKSTLRQHLLARTGLADLPRSRLGIELDPPHLRAMTSAVLYCSDLVRHRALAKPGIGDRCIIDTLCYLDAFQTLEWVNRQTFSVLERAIVELMRDIGWPERVILLNPEPAFLELNLARRAAEEPGRWRQNSRPFLEALTASYADLCRSGRYPVDTSHWLYPGDYRSGTLVEDCLAYLSRPDEAA